MLLIVEIARFEGCEMALRNCRWQRLCSHCCQITWRIVFLISLENGWKTIVVLVRHPLWQLMQI